MVVVRGFSARLVDATSKEPFPEYTGSKESQVYSEVKADSDCFVEIQVTEKTINPRRKYCFQFIVDGTKLESRTITNRKAGPGFVGILSKENDAVINTALCFKKGSNRGCKAQSCTKGMELGSVVVQISDVISTKNTFSLDDFQEDFGIGQPTSILYDGYGGLKGMLRLSKGMVSEASPSKCRARTYQAGRLLEEIKINYGTTLDLIYAGILPQPPLWEFHRMKHGLPEESINSSATTVPIPKLMKVDAVYDSSMMMVVSPREVELFDLTEDTVNAPQSPPRRNQRICMEEESPCSIPGLIHSP